MTNFTINLPRTKIIYSFGYLRYLDLPARRRLLEERKEQNVGYLFEKSVGPNYRTTTIDLLITETSGGQWRNFSESWSDQFVRTYYNMFTEL